MALILLSRLYVSIAPYSSATSTSPIPDLLIPFDLRGRLASIGPYFKAGENGLVPENELYADWIQLQVKPSFTHLCHGVIHTGPRTFVRDSADEPGPQVLICA